MDKVTIVLHFSEAYRNFCVTVFYMPFTWCGFFFYISSNIYLDRKCGNKLLLQSIGNNAKVSFVNCIQLLSASVPDRDPEVASPHYTRPCSFHNG